MNAPKNAPIKAPVNGPMDQTEDAYLGDARGGGAGTNQLVPSQFASIHGLVAVRARRR